MFSSLCDNNVIGRQVAEPELAGSRKKLAHHKCEFSNMDCFFIYGRRNLNFTFLKMIHKFLGHHEIKMLMRDK